MTNWNELNNDEKIAAIQKVAGIKHIPPQAVEKDLWVTIILQLVYTLPFADKIVFKGGTSLSKVFGKIDIFSEDIDLALDRTLFSMTGDVTKKQLKQLRKTSSLFVNGMFFEELQKVADYCAVFCDGKIVKVLPHEQIEEHTIMMYSTNSIQEQTEVENEE